MCGFFLGWGYIWPGGFGLSGRVYFRCLGSVLVIGLGDLALMTGARSGGGIEGGLTFRSLAARGVREGVDGVSVSL